MVLAHDESEIAVIGAGIAGLTLALALARQGFQTTIFERSKHLPVTGTGIQLSPNAYKLLDLLGLGRAFATHAFAPEGIDIRSGISGMKLSFFELGDSVVSRHGAPYLVLHRADLASILQKACAKTQGISFKFGHKLHSVERTDDRIWFDTLCEGAVAKQSAAILIGADGVGSKAREFVAGAAQPFPTKCIAWRAVLDMADVPSNLTRAATGLWLGPQAHLVHYPLQDGRQMNLVAITPWETTTSLEPGWIPGSDGRLRSAAYSGWTSEIQRLTSLDADWGGWPLNAVSQVGSWSQGRIGLIGDAAHAMVPFAAQGAATAIEDAWVLAQLCSQNRGDLPGALAQLSRARTARVNKIIALSDNNRYLYHFHGLAAHGRNIAMKLAPQSILQKRMDWVYGWTAS